MEVGDQFVRAHGHSVVALETGANASLVCLKWSQNRDSHLQQVGIPKVRTNPTKTRLKFGEDRIGEVRYAADIKVRIAARRGALAACVLEADIPALLRTPSPGA